MELVPLSSVRCVRVADRGITSPRLYTRRYIYHGIFSECLVTGLSTIPTLLQWTGARINPFPSSLERTWCTSTRSWQSSSPRGFRDFGAVTLLSIVTLSRKVPTAPTEPLRSLFRCSVREDRSSGTNPPLKRCFEWLRSLRTRKLPHT